MRLGLVWCGGMRMGEENELFGAFLFFSFSFPF